MSSPDSPTRKPTLQEVISIALEVFGGQLPKAMPARVTKYEAAKQRVSCKVLVQRPYFDESAARQVESIPVIPGVPVEFPGAGGFRITFPISDGNLNIDGRNVPATTGLLIWCDRSLDKWLTGSGQEVDPEFDHAHALTDAVFFPGLLPFGAPLGSAPTDHATVGADSGVQIHFHQNLIVAGDESGSDFLATKADLKAVISALSGAKYTNAAGIATLLDISSPAPPTTYGTTEFKAK